MNIRDTRPTHDAANPLRPEIALSWRRSQISGLDPSSPDLRFVSDVATRSGRLLGAARPVLGALADQLDDEPFFVVLADRDSHIIDAATSPRPLRGILERLGAVAGGLFLEENTGTNAIATTHELRRGIAVHGDEHYLESFKAFSCYGQPIIHPVTHRLEGVLDITCLSEHDSPLLRPVIARAARDIEANLLATSPRTQQRLLAEFQSAMRRGARPLVALGDNVILSSPSATALLGPVDHMRLGELADDLTAGHRRSGRPTELDRVLELESGQQVTVHLRVIEPGLDGVLIDIDQHTAARPSAGAESRIGRELMPGRPVYVGGAAGTGRTTSARALAAEQASHLIDAAEQQALTELMSFEQPSARTDAPPPALIVDNIHLLGELAALRLQRILDRGLTPLVLTGPPRTVLTGHRAVLAATCPIQIELPELRHRIADLPDLIQRMLADLGADHRIRFTPAALATLSGNSWPGNLSELNALVRNIIECHRMGDVTPRELPERYRVSARYRNLTALERAEYDAIIAALRSCHGNKKRAAQQLGISRTTIYNRMRALRIATD
ncbi:sigma-54-dependent Fis family transcriptional regulator [Nocardia brasiliensis]|uniref:sigma-54-dependent Fis family transcriptional regulator n=1 Tax=Nocardia brasiliensis TaxID=37326 RepID=UPI003D8AE885